MKHRNAGRAGAAGSAPRATPPFPRAEIPAAVTAQLGQAAAMSPADTPPVLSPALCNALTEPYARTICDLSARLANATGNLQVMGEINAALKARVEELEKKYEPKPAAKPAA